jgi:prolyl 4-hydroxylase
VENGELDPTGGSRCSNIDAGDSSVPVDQQDQMPMDGSDLGEPQRIDRTQTDQFHYDDLTRHIEEARVYLASGELKAKQLSSEVIEHCRNNHELCGMWSLMGECDANPGYMKMNCAPVCHSCDFLTIEGRCNLEERGEDVWGPGDLEKLFRKLTEEPFFSQNDVQILSSPDDGGPWVITMENVVSEEEAKSLIALGKQEGYERSLDVGGLKYDGTTESVQSTDRTSTNAWCTSNACLADEAVQNVTNRISDLVGIPETNSEHFQMLRYEEGQL